jgi:hypothetical protein
MDRASSLFFHFGRRGVVLEGCGVFEEVADHALALENQTGPQNFGF